MGRPLRPAYRRSDTPLRDLLFEAIQYGEQEDVKARLFETIDGAVDQQNLLDLLKRRALTNDALPVAQVEELRKGSEICEIRKRIFRVFKGY